VIPSNAVATLHSVCGPGNSFPFAPESPRVEIA
jgi:hypothetical protein